MTMTRRVTRSRNQNHDDESGSKTIKTDDVGLWSYLNHDVLLLFMMQLGVIDFLAFSGVCKSWRSVALSNWKRFMASKPPMLMHISTRFNKDKKCRLEDYEGRKFKTTLTHSSEMCCIGLTCGYLILFRNKTKDFWLVNLITRHELNFPPVPCVTDHESNVTCVLVFSPSISRLVFVILAGNQIWFSIAGEGSWNCVSSTLDITFKDLHAFKGKIYTYNSKNGHLCELTLNPEPKVTLLKTEYLLDDPDPYIFSPQLVSWGENLCVMESAVYAPLFNVYKLNFGEMEWVPLQDTGDEEHGFFVGDEGHGAAVKAELWADPWSHYGNNGGYYVSNGSGHVRCFPANEWWYFPHECLNVNLLDES